MFKRKKKTGIETPEFRKSAPPPPPPTSGTNAVKPNKFAYTLCSMQLGDLKNWVKTRAKIGDIAICHVHRPHCYIYYYLKPDDNREWIVFDEKYLENYLPKESKEDYKMEYKIDIDAMIKERLNIILDSHCTYSTPCGWCSKWDKECDKKIGDSTNIYVPRANKPIEDIKSGE